jgi:predicted O-methyltransferase YrrM
MINPKVVVELGTFDGLSMLYMLESCPDAQFYTIDINPKSGKYLKNKKVTRIIGDAAKCANQIPNDIDFIFEDTDHEYDTIDREFKAYYPKLKYDGVMVFDDMNHMLCPGATKWWRELWWNKVYLNTPTSCAKFSLPKIHPGYGMTAIIKRD